MPIKAVKVFPILRNGLGAFVLPCKRITIQFDKAGGSSKGLIDFMNKRLDGYAQENLKVEFKVVQKRGHPVVKGEYASGREKAICVRNLSRHDVEKKLNLLRNSTGQTIRHTKQQVESVNESVRGIWSPLHVDPTNRYKV